jgi:hypothetical protein
MTLAIFTQTNGQAVAVNPLWVRQVVWHGDKITLIRFGPNDFVEVKEEFIKVVMRIEKK